MSNIMGFDLGTSQSAGCYRTGISSYMYVIVENDNAQPGRHRARNEKYHPSYVQYDRQGKPHIAGIRAKMLADNYPKSTVYDSKRLIGRSSQDPRVAEYREILRKRGHYEISSDKGDVKIKAGGHMIAPEEVSAEILAEIMKDAFEQETSLNISKIVISVPAYFDDLQRCKTKEAAEIALRKMAASEYARHILMDVNQIDLYKDDIISLITEPAAAFITYMARGGAKNVKPGKYVMVFDFGAGTLDITIGTVGIDKMVKDPLTKNERYTIDLPVTHGDTALGGRDMDQEIIEYVVSELKGRHIEVDEALLRDIRDKAEKAKIALSDTDELLADYIAKLLGEKGITVDGGLLQLVREKAKEANRQLLAEESVIFKLPAQRFSVPLTREGIKESMETKIQFTDQGVTLPLTVARLERLMAPILDRCRAHIETAMDKAKVARGTISNIVMVGGPTFMPCVQRLVEEETGSKIEALPGWDPMLCVAEGAARYEGTIITDGMPFDYYISVNVFDSCHVAWKIVTMGEKANIEKSVTISVPVYSSIGVDNVSLSMVKGENNGGGLLSYKCIQHVPFSAAAMPKGEEIVRSIYYTWERYDLRPRLIGPDIDFKYVPIEVRCRITKDGLVVRPRFYDPSTGSEVKYPTLGVQDFGATDIIEQDKFFREWEKYARAFLKTVEDNIDREINELMIKNGWAREEAIEVYIKQKVPADVPFNELRGAANECIDELNGSTRVTPQEKEELVRQLRDALIECTIDNKPNRLQLLRAIQAGVMALQMNHE